MKCEVVGSYPPPNSSSAYPVRVWQEARCALQEDSVMPGFILMLESQHSYTNEAHGKVPLGHTAIVIHGSCSGCSASFLAHSASFQRPKQPCIHADYD